MMNRAHTALLMLALTTMSAPVLAQSAPASPVARDAQVSVGAEVAAVFGRKDATAFFNYTDYDHDTMRMSLNGATASEGTGRACLGDPLLALLWLARTLRDLGDPLRAGEVVLSGALGPMAVVRAGDVVEAEISGLGPVRVTFAKEELDDK